MAEPITRIAPTPSGYLHWGNAFSFVLTWLYAKSMSARLLLRIDDLDAARKRTEYVEDIFYSLEWIGLDYDLGPTGPDDFERHYSQRHRRDLYHENLQWLADQGHVFACKCSRAEVVSTPDQRHSAACRCQGHALHSPDTCWRMATSPGKECWHDLDGTQRTVVLHEEMRDPVLRRKDGLASYQLASVVDDAYYGVNVVVRGEDLIASTAIQRQISRLLPRASLHGAQLLHHPLVLDAEGQKLSKSQGATSLAEMRKQSSTPAPLFRKLSPVLGLPRTADTLPQTLELWLALHDSR